MMLLDIIVILGVLVKLFCSIFIDWQLGFGCPIYNNDCTSYENISVSHQIKKDICTIGCHIRNGIGMDMNTSYKKLCNFLLTLFRYVIEPGRTDILVEGIETNPLFQSQNLGTSIQL